MPKPSTKAATPEVKGGSGQSVTERELVVLNARGLHARPAAAWVRCARGYTSTVEILKDGQSFSAQSIFGVLSANLNEGATFILRAEGVDSEAAVAALAELLVEFHKQDA